MGVYKYTWAILVFISSKSERNNVQKKYKFDYFEVK